MKLERDALLAQYEVACTEAVKWPDDAIQVRQK